MTIRYEDLKQLKKIASISKAKSTLKRIRAELYEILVDPEFVAVYREVREAHDKVAHLSYFFDQRCRHCGKRLEFGYTICAGCADERGP